MQQDLAPIGWREYVALPELGVSRIKAKIDTGARSSALHAVEIERFQQQGKEAVRFQIPHHPQSEAIAAVAELVDMRQVKNSGGVSQLRPVIKTVVELGGKRWAIELTLTDRQSMGFPMLLGREALRHQFLVDAARSFVQSQP